MREKTHIIIDTSGMISLISSTDSNHAAAIAYTKHIKQHYRQLIYPGEVLAETVNVVGRLFDQTDRIAFLENILSSPFYEVVDTTHSIRVAAFEILKQSAGSVSFTDCLVMAFANQFDTKYIFGFDECFKKSGFVLPGKKEKRV